MTILKLVPRRQVWYIDPTDRGTTLNHVHQSWVKSLLSWINPKEFAINLSFYPINLMKSGNDKSIYWDLLTNTDKFEMLSPIEIIFPTIFPAFPQLPAAFPRAPSGGGRRRSARRWKNAQRRSRGHASRVRCELLKDLGVIYSGCVYMHIIYI